MLKDLFVSEVRIRILKLFLTDPKAQLHVREIGRRVGAEINAVRRELHRLQRIKFLKKDPRGNRIYYSARADFILYDELLGMITKEFGLGREILDKREDLGKISFAMLAKGFVKGRVSKPSEVDLLIVGKVGVPLLTRIVRKEEERLGHEINYTVLTPEEFDFRKLRKDPFIAEVLSQPRIVLIGNEEKNTRL